MYRVYLVDDERPILESIVAAVEWQENGLELIGQQTNPQKAVEEIFSLSPDVVFCDLKMPGMDGISLVRTCKEMGVKSEFVMLSAFADFEASRDFFLLGGHDYLLKPVNREALQLVLTRLTRKFTEKDPLAREHASPKTRTSFDALTAYLEENYHKKHTLKSLSTQFHLSETYICDLFSKHHGTTFTLYIASIRMREAAKLISQTDIPMKQICRMCGYPDYLYFCRVFKNHYGITPGAYREGGA